MSIASWTDPDGVTHWADDTSKAYRDRVEAAPAAPKPEIAPPAEDGEAFIPLSKSARRSS